MSSLTRRTLAVLPPLASLAVLSTLALCVVGPLAAAHAQEIPPQRLETPELGFALEARGLQGLRAQAATLLVQGGQGGHLPMAVFAAPSPATGSVPLVVEIEGLALLTEGTAETADGETADGATAVAEELRHLEIYAYALSSEGAVKGYLTQTVTFDPATWGEAVFAGGLKLVGRLELPPGEYSLRVLVFEPATQRYGLRTRPLVVPTAGEARPRVLGTVVPDPSPSWVLVRQDVRPARTLDTRLSNPAPTEGEGAAPPPPEPPALSPETAVAPLLAQYADAASPGRALPAAWPVLQAGTETRFDLLVQGLDGSDARLSLTPQPAAGEENTATPVAAPWRKLSSTTLGDGLARLEGRLTVPPADTGAYLLQVEAGGARFETPVLVLSEATPGEALAWGQIRSTLASPQERQAALADTELPARKKQRNRAMEKAVLETYRRTLAGLAGGRSPAAVMEALAAFERDLTERAPGEAVESLAAGKRALVRSLAEANPESLVPFLYLHAQLYRRYRTEGRFGLATHARQTVAELAESYAKEVETPGAANLASSALTLLGRDLLEARVWTPGSALLERALELDGGNDAARLLLAAHQEKMGQYDRAVTTLRQLVESNPKSAEGRLRLALNLRRSGQEAAGETLLRRLVAENNPPWTLAVAYSELAEMLMVRGQNRDASLLLRQALDRLPDEGALVLQLAYALDRQREFLEARDITARLAGRSVDPGPSPRHRYAVWPDRAVEETRALLDRGAMTRLPLLGLALEGDAGSGGAR